MYVKICPSPVDTSTFLSLIFKSCFHLYRELHLTIDFEQKRIVLASPVGTFIFFSVIFKCLLLFVLAEN